MQVERDMKNGKDSEHYFAKCYFAVVPRTDCNFLNQLSIKDICTVTMLKTSNFLL